MVGGDSTAIGVGDGSRTVRSEGLYCDYNINTRTVDSQLYKEKGIYMYIYGMIRKGDTSFEELAHLPNAQSPRIIEKIDRLRNLFPRDDTRHPAAALVPRAHH